VQDYEHVYAFHQDDDYFTQDRWYAWKVVKRTPRYFLIHGPRGPEQLRGIPALYVDAGRASMFR
jgi:hypothetical protein